MGAVNSCGRAKINIGKKCESTVCEFQEPNLICANFGFVVQRVRISVSSPFFLILPFWPSSCSFFLIEVVNFSPSLLILDVASPPATALNPFIVQHQVRPNAVGPRFCQSLKCVVFCLVWFTCLEPQSFPTFLLLFPTCLPFSPSLSHPGPHCRSSCPSVPLG